MLHYTRNLTLTPGVDPSELGRRLDDVFAHVTAELSAQASPTDDPDEHAQNVIIETTLLDADGAPLRDGQRAASVLVTGALDAQPVADYLANGYNPRAGVPDELLAHIRDDEPGGDL